MTDAVFTWMTGIKFCEDPGLQVYIKSLLECGFEGDKVVFTCEMTDKLRSQLSSSGFIVVDIPKSEVYWLYRDRHLAYYNWNCEHNYRYIVCTDSRDTLFQRNPIRFLGVTVPEEFEFVLLSSEGFTHSQSLTNTSNQGHYQAGLVQHRRDFKDWQVINGGTVAGTAKRMKYFDLSIWFAGLGRVAKDGDQAITNYASYYFAKDDSVKIAHPKDSRWCLTGEGLNVKAYTPMPREDYFIFHQWDRSQYATEIRARYL